MLDRFAGGRGRGGRFSGGSDETIGSAENILTALVPSVYVDGLGLGLILSISLSPSLAPNAGRVERVSVENAGLEPSSSSSSSSSSSTTTLAPPPPPPLCATLRIDHASLSAVVSGRAGTRTGTGEFTALPRSPSPSSSVVRLLRLILEGLNLGVGVGFRDVGDADDDADVVSISLPSLSALASLSPSTSMSSSYSRRQG